MSEYAVPISLLRAAAFVDLTCFGNA